MSRNYTVSTRIERPVAEVFDAIVSAKQLDKFFTNGTSGDLEEGQTITWHWDHWGDNPVTVKRVVKNELIELTINSVEWVKTKDDSYDVSVLFEFEALGENATRLSISESGWKTDADGYKASHENCEGWTHMAACLKAYLEHGIDLR